MIHLSSEFTAALANRIIRTTWLLTSLRKQMGWKQKASLLMEIMLKYMLAHSLLTSLVERNWLDQYPIVVTMAAHVARPKAYTSFAQTKKNGRVTFPETRAPRRTDESFRRREHPEHHSRDMGRSPVEDLRTNMVDIFLQRNCISWILEQLRRLYYSLSKSTHQQDWNQIKEDYYPTEWQQWASTFHGTLQETREDSKNRNDGRRLSSERLEITWELLFWKTLSPATVMIIFVYFLFWIVYSLTVTKVSSLKSLSGAPNSLKFLSKTQLRYLGHISSHFSSTL